MSTASFRNKTSEFRRSSVSRVDTELTSGLGKTVFIVKPEDQLILDFIDNVDFDTLYRSKEFNEMLDKRLFIKKIHRSLFPER